MAALAAFCAVVLVLPGGFALAQKAKARGGLSQKEEKQKKEGQTALDDYPFEKKLYLGRVFVSKDRLK